MGRLPHHRAGGKGRLSLSRCSASIGRMCRNGGMLRMLIQEQLGGGRVKNHPRSYRADFLVNRSLLPGSARAKMIIDSSGTKCLELCGSSGPLGCLERMLLESSTWRSTIFLMIWKVRNTRRGHSIYQLGVLKRRTKDKGSLSLPTLTKTDASIGQLKGKEFSGTRHTLKLEQAINSFPTLLKTDAHGHGYQINRNGQKNLTLPGFIKALPTITARDYKGSTKKMWKQATPIEIWMGRCRSMD